MAAIVYQKFTKTLPLFTSEPEDPGNHEKEAGKHKFTPQGRSALQGEDLELKNSREAMGSSAFPDHGVLTISTWHFLATFGHFWPRLAS